MAAQSPMASLASQLRIIWQRNITPVVAEVRNQAATLIQTDTPMTQGIPDSDGEQYYDYEEDSWPNQSE